VKVGKSSRKRQPHEREHRDQLNRVLLAETTTSTMSCGHDDRMAAAVLPDMVTDGASRTAWRRRRSGERTMAWWRPGQSAGPRGLLKATGENDGIAAAKAWPIWRRWTWGDQAEGAWTQGAVSDAMPDVGHCFSANHGRYLIRWMLVWWFRFVGSAPFWAFLYWYRYRLARLSDFAWGSPIRVVL
jgi:hypothetical protein